jgi:hypothetical protein
MKMRKQADDVSINKTNSMEDHYSFDYRKAKPNRFATKVSSDHLMIVLDPDVAEIFPTSEAVNEALRVLAGALAHLPKTPRRRKQAATIAHVV